MTEGARAIEKEKLEREERENERQAVLMSEEKNIDNGKRVGYTRQ